MRFVYRSVALLLIALSAGCTAHDQSALKGDGWQEAFDVERDSLVTRGRNRYFILEPGYQLVLEGTDDGRDAQLVITVLDETKRIDGVETRIVEERESVGGELKEVSRNYIAIDKWTNDVYYFGEDVDDYRDGKIVGHGGAWHAGETNTRFGLLMPAKPRVGYRHYQEISPGKAMDRAEIISTNETVRVPAGEFKNCLKTQETTPLEPRESEEKLYAPNVGLLTDEGLKLVRYGQKDK